MLYCNAITLETLIPRDQSVWETVQRIRKKFNESNGDYEGKAASKPHYDRSNKNTRIRGSDRGHD